MKNDQPGARRGRPYAEFRTMAVGLGASGRIRTVLLALAGLALLGTALLSAGFFAFLGHVSRYETEFGRTVDGVVALTGGPERIADALSVLAEGRAKRLLITGVGERTVAGDLIRHSGHARLFDCCVDLDRRALNTVGNAEETARWAGRHGYRSLMIVTSNFHMPRALLELRRRLKDTEFVPHPVIADSVRIDQWWADMKLARLIMIEYLKFIVAEARSRLLPDNP